MRRELQLASLLTLAVLAPAQERTTEAQVGFEQYYVTDGGNRIANVSGLTLGYRRVLPDIGILQINLTPAANAGRFQTGESFIELKDMPWLSNYWTFRGGDFRLRSHVLDVSFNNLYDPELTGRGMFVEATHGGRTVGIILGRETLQAGIRVPLRLVTPQTIGGAYLRQKLGERLLVGARILNLATNLEQLRKTPYLAPRLTPTVSATTAVVDGLYTISGSLKWFAEAGVSTSEFHRKPYSATIGPLLETERFTFKANYLYQADSYLPLLGYYLGDRRGPYGEMKLHPFDRLELFASISDYRNNVARDPQQYSIHSVSATAGASLRLHARFALSGQWSNIKLATRVNDDNPWERADSKQTQVTLARPIFRHNVRLTARDFQQFTRLGVERQRTVEAEDSFHYRWLTLGAAARLQRLLGRESKTSLYFRGNAQVNVRRLSAYAHIESGNDLANRTLFATSTVRNTVIGGSVYLSGGWQIYTEAFRTNLLTELNEENIFVLQGQGVFVPTVLSMFNQWSFYVRMVKQFGWGSPLPSKTGGSSSVNPASLKGTIEGFVVTSGNRPAVGIPVSMDGGEPVLTNAEGRFLFEEVAEGARKVSLAMDQLPTDFDPGVTTEVTALVRPGKHIRVTLSVISLGSLRGAISAPADLDLRHVMIKLLPLQRYTTAESTGEFAFYNLPEGDYSIEVVQATLPPSSALASLDPISVSVDASKPAPDLRLALEVRAQQKPVRKIDLPPTFDQPH